MTTEANIGSEDPRKKHDGPEESDKRCLSSPAPKEKTKKLRAATVDVNVDVSATTQTRKSKMNKNAATKSETNNNDESATDKSHLLTQTEEASVEVVVLPLDNDNYSHAKNKATGDSPEKMSPRAPQLTPSSSPVVWDLETALHRLMGDKKKRGTKEYLTENEEDYVTYRWAHAGDASTIASWYRQSIRSSAQKYASTQVKNCAHPPYNNTSPSSKAEETAENDSLELWLQDGLGDEDTPPAVNALLAHRVVDGVAPSNKDTAQSELGAIALLTLAWEEGKRLLRVEWYRVDPSLGTTKAELLGRRLWLRLSALALLTVSTLVIHDDPTESITVVEETEETDKASKEEVDQA